VSGTELDRVPGGYNSGSLAYSGSFKVCLGREGHFNFVRFVQFITATPGKMFQVEDFVPLKIALACKSNDIDIIEEIEQKLNSGTTKNLKYSDYSDFYFTYYFFQLLQWIF